MPVIQNQGFRQDLNLIENTNDVQTLNNLGGAGIANDLRIIQNNLRNTDELTFSTGTSSVIAGKDGFFDNDPAGNGVLGNGVFKFPGFDSVFTDGDRVRVGTDIINSVGGKFLDATKQYIVVNSNGIDQFQLQEEGQFPRGGPINLVYDSADVKLIRDSSVSLENTINFIKPNTISGFSFLTNTINDKFENVQNRVELGVFNITKKYKGNADTTTNDELKYEGTVVIKDPQGFNSSTLNVNSGFAGNSPGVYIGEIRAFSSDNNPWTFTNLGSFTAAPSQDSSNRISTQSTEVSIGELFIDANQNPNAGNGGFISIQNTDLSDINPPESVESDLTFTHKLPIVINGETYFMLMKEL